jgi:predicted dehydrogenase
LRLGVIGGYGHHYLLRLADAEDRPLTRIAAASDGADADAAKRLAERLAEQTGERPAFYDDAAKMLDAFEPEVVTIGGVYAHNQRWVLEVAKRGIPLVSDKPMVTEWSALAELGESLQASGSTAICEFPDRANPAFLAARDAIASGAAGEVVLVSAQKSYRFGKRPAWYASEADYAGTTLWVASHAIDWVRFVTGLEYRSVTGAGDNVARPDYSPMHEYTAHLFEMENRASALVHADYCNPDAAAGHGDDRMRIAGSKGVIEIDATGCRLTTHEHETTRLDPPAEILPLERQLLDALLQRRSTPYRSVEARRTAAAMLAARDAIRQRAPVAVPAEP